MSFYKEPLQWIRLSVESILSQSFEDFEFIVICDNPDYQEGIGYLKDMARCDKRIKLHINKINIGLTKSLNLGVKLSTGEYIARMDADDIACGGRLEAQASYLDSHPEVAVCATDAHIINDAGEIVKRNKYKGKYQRYGLFITNTIAHSSVMFRKSLVTVREPIYDESYRYAQDYELWQFLLLKGCRIDILPESLLLYRKSQSQISAANKPEQSECFRKAHKNFILNWLCAKGVITKDEGNDLKTILNKITRRLHDFKEEDRKWLILAAYIIYNSLISIDWKYRIKYIFDRNMIIFRIDPALSYRLFFAKKARRNRISLL